MARLFISYKREEQDYAFALRQWLMNEQHWATDEIFIDREKLRAGESWAEKIFAEAERSEVMLFLASHASLQPESFCYKELQRARGITLAVTIKGLLPNDERLQSALPHGADARQITALDGQPTDPFAFISPIDGTHGVVGLNRPQVESIGQMLRDLGVAPNSFKWTRTAEGPYPGLAALQEGQEAIFFGRDIEIRDCMRQLDEIRKSVNDRVLLIQAPSGAGKSSFLRAGLWKRLRRHSGFTPLAIVRVTRGALSHNLWGLGAGLAMPEANSLRLTLGEIEERIQTDFRGLLAAIADADISKQQGRRTLLLGIDQAEEMARLDERENSELEQLLTVVSIDRSDLDVRLVLTVRDDSIDSTLERLERAGIGQDQVRSFRLHRMPHARFMEIINGPAAVARRENYPLDLSDELSIALASAATENLGKIGDALPILALSLQRLVKKHRAPDGRITLKPNMAERFISEAVLDATDDALAATKSNISHLRRLTIPQLVTWDPRAGEGGAAKRQVAVAGTLFRDDRSNLQGLADELVNQRLLTKTFSAEGALYEVSHEALLRAAPLGDLIKGLREKFLRADVLKLEIQEWKDSGRKPDRLARAGERLREAQRLLKDEDFGSDLSIPDLELTSYLEACAAKEREDSEWRDLAERYRAAGLEAAKRRVEGRGSTSESRHDTPSRVKVYITYSRRDALSAERLANELREAGVDPFLDVRSIAGGEDWKQRLDQLILEADTLIFLVSPSSVSSEVCKWELDSAFRLKKRVFPVVLERPDSEVWPAQVRNLNPIFLTSEDEWVLGLDALVTALSTDMGWVREHTRLGELSVRWERSGRSQDLLLRGSELRSALDWRQRRPAGAPELTSAHKSYIDESEHSESQRQNAERQRLELMAAAQRERERALESAEQAMQRTSRRTIVGLAATVSLAALVVFLGIYANMQREAALKQSDLAEVAANAATQAKQATEEALVRAQEAEVARAQLVEAQRASLDQTVQIPVAPSAKAEFLDKLTVDKLIDGRSVQLSREFTFLDSSGTRWTVPAGAVVEGSSIPKTFWSVIGSPYSGDLLGPALLYDYFSVQRKQTTKEVNQMFYEAMLAAGMSTEKARLVYIAVERFGPKW